jgi:hypothetical protein
MKSRASVRRVSRPLILASALLWALLIGPAGAASAGTLDQQQTNALGFALGVDKTQSVAQTFTPNLTGGIDRVDLHLGKISFPSVPLTVEIRDVSAGLPGNSVLASSSVAASDVPPDIAAAFTPVNFAAPAPVSAGTQYAIVAYSSTPSGTNYTWRDSGTINPYADGVGVFAVSSPPSTAWNSVPQDLAFRTYVVPPLPPTTTAPSPSPTMTGQREEALKKCKKKRSAKARKRCRNRANRLPV